MKKPISLRKFLPIYVIVLIGCLLAAVVGSRTVTVMVENAPLKNRTCIVVDAGHGGIDGGATSCSGILESHTNLEIALRLNDLLRLLGYDTRMVRTTDTSVYTEGNSIAAQKISDLKQRVKLVNETDNALLISIHQNTFSDSRYRGAQVFYADDDISRHLADKLQTVFRDTINPGSRRKSKPSDGVYLMQHIQRPGLLVECGFISNPEEDALLQSDAYQKKMVCVIATVISSHANL